MERHQQSTRLGRPPKQEARQTRERILDAALERFAAQGYAGTSLRQIAQAVGIKESAIYAHFASKEAVFRTLSEQMVTPAVLIQEVFGSNLADVVRREPAAVVRQLMQQIIEMWNTPRARLFFSVMMREGKLEAIHSVHCCYRAFSRLRRSSACSSTTGWSRGACATIFLRTTWCGNCSLSLANIRALYWHAQATEEQSKLGYHRANLHIEYFLSTVLLPNADKTQA